MSSQVILHHNSSSSSPSHLYIHHHLLQSQPTKTYPSAWPVLFSHKDQQPCPSYIDLSQHEFHVIKCAIPLSHACSIKTFKTRFLKFICHYTWIKGSWAQMGGHGRPLVPWNKYKHLARAVQTTYSITEVWIVSENKYSRPFESNSYHISMKHFWWCSAYRTIWVIYGIVLNMAPQQHGQTFEGQKRNVKWFLEWYLSQLIELHATVLDCVSATMIGTVWLNILSLEMQLTPPIHSKNL